MQVSVRRIARDTLIVLGVSFGLLVALEIFLRLFAPQSLTGRPVRGDHFSVPDPLLGSRYIPGAVWRFRHPEYEVEYAINAAGFRDTTTRTREKPLGVTRILLLGDSFTFGLGVNYEQTWPVIAERELKRQGMAIDLIKAGREGADTRSELILLRRLARTYHIDAVILGFLINDLYTNVPYAPSTSDSSTKEKKGSNQQSVFRQVGQYRTFHLLTLVRRMLQSIDLSYILIYLAAPARGEYLRLPLSEAPARQLNVTETLLRQVAAFCDSLGKPLIVYSLPQQFQVLYASSGRADPRIDVGYYDRHFTQVAATAGFQWVATVDAFVEARKSIDADLFYPLDGHFTSAGNSVAAQIFIHRVLPQLQRSLVPSKKEVQSSPNFTR